MWWNANENCEAILGGQNAGFALFIASVEGKIPFAPTSIYRINDGKVSFVWKIVLE